MSAETPTLQALGSEDLEKKLAERVVAAVRACNELQNDVLALCVLSFGLEALTIGRVETAYGESVVVRANGEEVARVPFPYRKRLR